MQILKLHNFFNLRVKNFKMTLIKFYFYNLLEYLA